MSKKFPVTIENIESKCLEESKKFPLFEINPKFQLLIDDTNVCNYKRFDEYEDIVQPKCKYCNDNVVYVFRSVEKNKQGYYFICNKKK